MKRKRELGEEKEGVGWRGGQITRAPVRFLSPSLVSPLPLLPPLASPAPFVDCGALNLFASRCTALACSDTILFPTAPTHAWSLRNSLSVSLSASPRHSTLVCLPLTPQLVLRFEAVRDLLAQCLWKSKVMKRPRKEKRTVQEKIQVFGERFLLSVAPQPAGAHGHHDRRD